MACKLATDIRKGAAKTPLRFGARLAALFVLVFLALGWSDTSALASAVGCRGDPLIIFKRGQTLQMIIRISVPAAQVDFIEYTVHVPPNAKIKQIVYTGKKLRDKESVVIVYDAPPKTFVVDAIVHTQADANVRLIAKYKNRSGSARGRNEQLLTVPLLP